MAGLPLPSVFIADHDLTGQASGIAGFGDFTCTPLSWTTGLRVARSIEKLAELIVEDL